MPTTLHRRAAMPVGGAACSGVEPLGSNVVEVGGSASDGARSLTDKALSILGAFSADRDSLTLTSIARRAGLPLSTTHRIVQELLAWGALERHDHAGYAIGIRLWEVASLTPRGPRLRDTALPYMGDLYEATHENVQLAVRDQDETVFVEQLMGRDAVPVVSRVGGRFPLPAGGVGLVLLAYAPSDVQERVLAAPLPCLTPYSVTDPRALRRVLAEVRRGGFAVASRQVSVDALSVAAPVFGPREQLVGAVSVVIRAEGAEPAALVPAVRAAARGLSRALGSDSANRSPLSASRTSA